MLPDYPEVKRKAGKALLKAVERVIPEMAPLLKGIKRTRIHEGAGATFTRQDESVDRIRFRPASAQVKLSAEQMKFITMDELIHVIRAMAEQLAEQQVKLLLTRAGQAAAEAGNEVSASTLGSKEAFLEMRRRIHTDFDPQTLKPKGLTLVLHPSQVEGMKKRFDEWSRDPAWVAELERIRLAKIEEWRAREDRRKLVD